MNEPNLEEMAYDALLDWCNVLLDIINELPNVAEIKQSIRYQEAYQKYNEAVSTYFNDKRAWLSEVSDE